ncbi:phospholipase A2 inhibitor subunit gamma B-like [Python bivittatus]|uniref:Phospholipase A2 inhibitor subunit gamma B-like n=1 Tax=Python bivittatus TaxID=176946 RepID=A0A9F3QSR7_PYTBI|nr:phospholipase A2 inhibitor subunit gamma B-like [Python bivittatus]XP_015744929.1 phospholipase A2 inhibitor subunit gamma B-like [Python bivittatus]
MQLLLGLFLFSSSVLLTAGSSLECETCTSFSADCSGPKQRCPGNNVVCMTLKTEIATGMQAQTTMKTCSTEDICKKFAELKGKTPTGQLPNMPSEVPSIQPGALIKDVVCSKASPSFALFFPAFFGVLLLKLLF